MLRVEVAEALQRAGIDVLRTAECGRARADDADVLHTAIEQDRTLITVDKHFGDWAVLPLTSHPGVIRVRVHPPLSLSIVAVVLPFLQNHDQSEFKNHLIIVSPTRVRWVRTGV